MQSFRLRALDSFRCTGGECTFTCCQGWNISLEPEIVAKWEALEPGPFRQNLLAAVDSKKAGGQESLLIRKGANGKCVLLDETGLCSVHKQSENLLAAICRDYPRMTRHHGARKLTTANLSCPEVVRLVLAAETADQFQVSEDGFPAPAVLGGAVEQIGLLLEDFARQAMAERRFPLATRIAGIAEVLAQLALRSQQGAVGLPEVQRLCAKPRQRLYELNQKSRSRHFKPQPAVAGRFWKFIISSLSASDAQTYFDPAITQSELVQRALAARTDAECEALYAEITGYRDRAVFELSEPNQTYGEKYLSVKFMNSGFPITPAAGNFIASFIYCIYPYALIQVLLWLLSAQNGKVDDTDVFSIISRAERMLSHNDRIYRYLDQDTAALRLDLYYQCLMDL